MQTLEAIRHRKSIRAYKTDSIPEEAIKTLEEAINLAPTGANRQAFVFYFVQDKEKLADISGNACRQDFVKQVPLIIAATCDEGRSFDAAIAMENCVIAAEDLGLGTCWIGSHDRDQVRRALSIPDDKEIPALLTVGYPAEEPERRQRKPIDEIIKRV